MSFYHADLADLLVTGTEIPKDAISSILQTEDPIVQLINYKLPVFNFIENGEIKNCSTVKKGTLTLLEKDVVLNTQSFQSLIRNYDKEILNEPLNVALSGNAFQHYKNLVTSRLVEIAERLRPVGKTKQIDILFKEICDEITSKPDFASRIFNAAASSESKSALDESVNISVMSMITAFHYKTVKNSSPKEINSVTHNSGTTGFLCGLSSVPERGKTTDNIPYEEILRLNDFSSEIIESVAFFEDRESLQSGNRKSEIADIVAATIAFIDIKKQAEEYALTVLNEFGNQGKLNKEIVLAISSIYHKSNAEIINYILGLKNICRTKHPYAKEPIIKCNGENPYALGCVNTSCSYASHYKNLNVLSEIRVNLPEYNLRYVISVGEYHTCSMTNLITQRKKEILKNQVKIDQADSDSAQ